MTAIRYLDARAARAVTRVVFGIPVFALLLLGITSKETKRLNDFDQTFYLTIAYDLDRHGVFSNGIFDDTDSTVERPPSGMIFGPIYPLLVLATMKADTRFARAVQCAVESNQQKRDGASCDIYAGPIHVLHALLLTVGVLAIAFSGEIIFARPMVFYVSAALSALALLPEADLFSYIMTESATFALYGVASTALVWGLKTARPIGLSLSGFFLGLLVLTRPSFLVLAIVIAVLIAAAGRSGGKGRISYTQVLMFGIAFAVAVVPWMARNYLSVGKWGLTEEYGALAVVERFAFNSITAKEFVLALPYCIPGIGPRLIERWAGADAMARFDWREPKGFFSEGRARRMALVAEHGRLDPIIGELVRQELRTNWWRYLLATIPLAWCGLWIGQVLGLLLIPLFVWACKRAAKRGPGLFLLYTTPPLFMVALHAAVANHYTRYNLVLVGPASVGAAWIIARLSSRIARNAKPIGQS